MFPRYGFNNVRKQRRNIQYKMSRKHIFLEESFLLDQSSGRGSHLSNSWQAKSPWSRESCTSLSCPHFQGARAGDCLLDEESILINYLSSLASGWLANLNVAAMQALGNVSQWLNRIAAGSKLEHLESFRITLWVMLVQAWGAARAHQLPVACKAVWKMRNFSLGKKNCFVIDVSGSSYLKGRQLA